MYIYQPGGAGEGVHDTQVDGDGHNAQAKHNTRATAVAVLEHFEEELADGLPACVVAGVQQEVRVHHGERQAQDVRVSRDEGHNQAAQDPNGAVTVRGLGFLRLHTSQLQYKKNLNQSCLFTTQLDISTGTSRSRLMFTVTRTSLAILR